MVTHLEPDILECEVKWALGITTTNKLSGDDGILLSYFILKDEASKVATDLEKVAGFRKGGGTRDQLANICWITEKAKEFQKNIYFCFTHWAKAFDCVDHNKL